MSFKYLILDLDNTLYPKSSGMLQHIDGRIDQYIAATTDISPAQIPAIRNEYWKNYGTTLGGMVLHHRIKPEDYLKYAYEVNVAQFIQADPELRTALQGIDLKKIVFSNSPLAYVQRVLETLGIDEMIEAVYDIQFCEYLGKPNPSSYQRVLEDLGALGQECIFVDDVVANTMGAEQSGMTAILLAPAPSPGIRWNIGLIHELPGVIPEIFKHKLSA